MIYSLRARGKCLAADVAAQRPRACHYSRDGFNCFDHIQWWGMRKVHGKCRTIDRAELFRNERDKSLGFGDLPPIVYRTATGPLLNPSVICDRSLPTFPIMSPRERTLRIKFHLACRKGWIMNIRVHEIECRDGVTLALSIIDWG